MVEDDGSKLKRGISGSGVRRRDALAFGAGTAMLSLIAPRAAWGGARAQPAFVEIADGKLRGEKAGGILSFKGIP